MVNVDEITPHPANPRRGDVAVMSESVEGNGFYGSVLVQESTGHILVGNHRYLAVSELWDRGATVTWPPTESGEREPFPPRTIPAMFVDVDDEQAKRILVADNRTSDIGGYDTAQLVDLLTSFDDHAGTGYTSANVAELIDELSTDFGPDAEGQGKLDQRAEITCPECGHHWQP
jgi:hypothetical protein